MRFALSRASSHEKGSSEPIGGDSGYPTDFFLSVEPLLHELAKLLLLHFWKHWDLPARVL